MIIIIDIVNAFIVHIHSRKAVRMRLKNSI